jgi:hypothetical protein
MVKNEEIIQVDQICNLGIIFSKDFSFSSHINSIYLKALRGLGFLKINCAEFKYINCFIALYCILVRLILKFWSVI